MRAGRYIIVAWIAWVCFSCVTHETICRSGDQGGEKVPVSFYIVFNQGGQSRAASWNFDHFFPGITDDEKRVDNVLIISFKNDYLEEFVFFRESDFDRRPDGTIFLGKDNESIIDLEPGAHHFYIQVNIPEDLYDRFETLLEANINNISRQEFEKVVISVVNKEYLTVQNGSPLFYMTNVNEPSFRVVYSDAQIEQNPGLNNEMELSVGRAVAKVSLAYAASEVDKGELQGKLSRIRYKVAQNPGSMYVAPVFVNEVLRTPHYGNTTINKTYFTPQLSAIQPDDSDWLRATTPESLAAGIDVDFDYCIENSNAKPGMENSTLLLIEAQFHPAICYDALGEEADPHVDGTFWRVVQLLANGKEQYYRPEYYCEYPNEAMLKEKYQNFIIHEYPNGTCYYHFLLKNKDQYTVKRNDYFKMVITHVHAAGSLDKEDPGPDEIESVSTYGRVSIQGTNWNEYFQEEALGKRD